LYLFTLDFGKYEERVEKRRKMVKKGKKKLDAFGPRGSALTKRTSSTERKESHEEA